MKQYTEHRTWADFLAERSKVGNMGMRFGMGNVRSLYRVGCLMTVSKELSTYKLDLVGM
jgi:hypothetical protein